MINGTVLADKTMFHCIKVPDALIEYVSRIPAKKVKAIKTDQGNMLGILIPNISIAAYLMDDDSHDDDYESASDFSFSLFEHIYRIAKASGKMHELTGFEPSADDDDYDDPVYGFMNYLIDMYGQPIVVVEN